MSLTARRLLHIQVARLWISTTFRTLGGSQGRGVDEIELVSRLLTALFKLEGTVYSRSKLAKRSHLDRDCST